MQATTSVRAWERDKKTFSHNAPVRLANLNTVDTLPERRTMTIHPEISARGSLIPAGDGSKLLWDTCPPGTRQWLTRALWSQHEKPRKRLTKRNKTVETTHKNQETEEPPTKIKKLLLA